MNSEQLFQTAIDTGSIKPNTYTWNTDFRDMYRGIRIDKGNTDNFTDIKEWLMTEQIYPDNRVSVQSLSNLHLFLFFITTQFCIYDSHILNNDEHAELARTCKERISFKCNVDDGIHFLNLRKVLPTTGINMGSDIRYYILKVVAKYNSMRDSRLKREFLTMFYLQYQSLGLDAISPDLDHLFPNLTKPRGY